MKFPRFGMIAAAVLAAAFLYLLAGCSEQERRGLSPLPQNRPAAWETQPCGPMRN